MSSEESPILPAHIEETIQAIARLHAEHHSQATPMQRLSDRMTSLIGRPRFLGVVTTAVLGWIGANLAARMAGVTPLDDVPFNWLQLAVGLVALYITGLILTTQRREDELAGYREQLTLELAILSEQKASKIIELLEELRRDSPDLRNRTDQHAEAMAVPADPQTVLDAIKGSHGSLETQQAEAGP